MKKKLIYSSALAALLSASSIALAGGPEIIPIEDYFSGFYVGGTGSMHHATLDGSSTVSLNQTINNPITGTPIFTAGNILSNDADGGSVDGYGGVQGGFGWTFNHVWYLGVQGFGEFGSQSNTSNSSSVPVNNTTPSIPLGLFQTRDQATVTNSTTVKIGNDYGVAAKLGYVVAPRTMVYGKIGASWANITVSNTSTVNNNFAIDVLPPLFPNAVTVNTSATASSSTTQNGQIGLLLGIGFEQFIYQDVVSLNVEYDYVNYGSVDTGPASFFGSTIAAIAGNTVFGPTSFNSGDVVTSQASGSATVNSILGGINFYFGRNWF